MHKMLIAVWAAVAAAQWVPAWPADAASALPGAASRGCDACPEMVSIAGGEFMMGTPAGESERDNDEGPQRRVQVKPFALGKTEVTVAQWREFARASGYLTEAERNVHAQGCFTWELADAARAWRAGRSWRAPGDDPLRCCARPSVSGWGRQTATTTSGCGWPGPCRSSPQQRLARHRPGTLGSGA